MTIIKETRAAIIGQYSTLDRSEGAKNNFNLVEFDSNGNLSAYWPESGYTQVGTAEVEITLFPEAVVTANAVDALRKQRSKELAESQMRITKIDEAIQNLLAITN